MICLRPDTGGAFRALLLLLPAPLGPAAAPPLGAPLSPVGFSLELSRASPPPRAPVGEGSAVALASLGCMMSFEARLSSSSWIEPSSSTKSFLAIRSSRTREAAVTVAERTSSYRMARSPK